MIKGDNNPGDVIVSKGPRLKLKISPLYFAFLVIFVNLQADMCRQIFWDHLYSSFESDR